MVVDLGRGSIKMAAAEAAGESVRFHGITRLSLSSEDGQRAEPDPAELARRIGAEVERRGWRGMRAACLLSGSATSTQSFLFPKMPGAELRDALALKMRESLHFDLDQACFAFRTVREQEHQGREQVLMLAAAAKREAIERALAVLREAGLQPVAIGSAAESLANLALYARLCREDEVSIHVDVGSTSTILNLFDGRWLRFSREIDCAGESFTRALMRPILSARGAVHLTRSQAEEVKLACGYPHHGRQVDLPHGVHSLEVLPLLEPVTQRLSAEIRRSIDYLCGILERLRVDRILLSGPGGQMSGLDSALEENLDTPVTFTDPVSRAKAHWRLAISDDDAPPLAGFAAILGYSLGNQQPINLLPRDEKVQELARQVSRVRAGVTPGALGLGLCLAAAAVPVSGTYRAARSALRSTAEGLDQRLRRETTLAEEHERTRLAAEDVLAARGPVPDWAGSMKDLAALLPREARLTSLSVERSAEQLTARLTAETSSADVPFEAQVAELTAALSGSPFFRDVHVVDATRTARGSTGHVEATLRFVAPSDPPWKTQP